VHALAFGGFSLVGAPLFAIIKAYLGVISSHIFLHPILLGFILHVFGVFNMIEVAFD
jgi:hypothetical protein